MIYSREILQTVLDNIVAKLEPKPNDNISFKDIEWPTEFDIGMEIDSFVKIVYLKKLIRDEFLCAVNDGMHYEITAEGVLCSRQESYINGHEHIECYYGDEVDVEMNYLDEEEEEDNECKCKKCNK